MIHKTPDEMLSLVNEMMEPLRVPGCMPVHLIIRNGHLYFVNHFAHPKIEIEVMGFSRRMLTKGLTGVQWNYLKRQLIKFQKEITN